MRFVRLSDGATGVLVAAGVVDVDAALAAYASHRPEAADSLRRWLPTRDSSWFALIDAWDSAADVLAHLVEWAVAEGQLGEALGARRPAPLPGAASGIFAIGANFASHAARSQLAIEGEGASVPDRVKALLAGKESGTPPWGFQILPRTVAGDGEEVYRPTGAVRMDYEGEVAAVLRRPHPGQPAQIWGVASWNDVSVRDPYFPDGRRIDEGPITWVLQKNFDGGSAMGPCVVVDEGLDPQNLDITTSVNGEVRQRGNTSEMVYSFAEAASYLDQSVTLRSGDVIASGTPAGTAFESGADGPYLQDGDVITVDVSGVGVLTNALSRRP